MSRAEYRVFLLVFATSGFAALLYQVSWERQIGLLFGHTAQASAVVLASFFFGMSAGYGIGAALGRRVHPLLGYAVAEILVASWAMAVPLLLDSFNTPERLDWLTSSSPSIQVALRGAFCIALLLPATVALGATLPLLAVFLAQETESAGDRITLAYAWNTVGAFLGVACASMFMFVEFGVRGSSDFAAVLSASIGLGSMLLWGARRRSERHVINPSTSVPDGDVAARSAEAIHWSNLLFMSLAAGSGGAVLILEVLYTRLFSLIFHNSSQTFGLTVAVFLAGLAAGAAIVPRLARTARSETLLGAIYVCASLAIGLSVVTFVGVSGLEYFRTGNSFIVYLIRGVVFSFGIMFVPALLLGTTLPLLWKCIAISRTSEWLGTITMVNTGGAGVGALSASFFLLPTLGLWGSFAAVSAFSGLLGGILLLAQGRWISSLTGITLSVMCAASLVLGGRTWNESRSSGGETVLRRWESAYGWIDVVQLERTGERKIRQNLHYRLGSTGSGLRERRQAHLPLFLHENPRDVLLLGQGTGITAAGALMHPEVERITIVELVPEVVEAARTLSSDNDRVLDDPKVAIAVDDARHFLLRSTRRWDVILSDLFVPWESYTGYLYTREHYLVAKARLAPEGLFCQWLPLYQLGPTEFDVIAETFRSVFPEMTLWWGQLDENQAMVALIGREPGQNWDVQTIDRRTQSAAERIRDPSVESAERIIGLAAGRWKPLNNVPLNTDEYPRIEFLTPWSQGDNALLKGARLRAFYESRFKELPEIEFTAFGRERPTDPRTSRAWHHLIMFGAEEEK